MSDQTTKNSATRRNVIWGMSSLSALVLLFGYHTSTSATEASAATGTPGTSTTGTSGAGTSASSGTTSSSDSSTTASGNDGTSSSAGSNSASDSSSSSSGTASSSTSSSASSTTVTGEAAQTRWGPVQVQLTVSGGKVTAVDVVQYPDSNGRDQEINARALPILVQETLSAQSAQIDMVSGATYTSDGYTTSLQSALDQAGLA
ncbi:FMN-binding protein [Streptomyces sp. NP160]|uniref:FMN-binding protein n=1 Tax=Streptomyces sp. NP160 TaxID=2586637 RepID=UPI0011186FC7|nr:FMN-binding protein [Streptomyces sp. NP160]TNM68126.1 FMN-binding protein [Streptomyces sp. NP160]